jgi:hypothetical protein
MADPIELRMANLARLSDHFRLLADLLMPEPVSAEIVAVANDYDNEIARLRLEGSGAHPMTEAASKKQAA